MRFEILAGYSRRYLLLSMCALLALVLACGGGDDVTGDAPSGSSDGGGADATEVGTASDASGDDASAASAEDACSLATPDMVTDAFGGDAGEGVSAASTVCVFTLTGDVSDTVAIHFYGYSALWDEMRDSAGAELGEIGDVEGVGDEAFGPKSTKEGGVVFVKTGDLVFSVYDVNGDVESVQALARAIVDSQ